MNIWDEMFKKSYNGYPDPTVREMSLETAVKIAEKYADSKCQEQKEICAEALWTKLDTARSVGEYYTCILEAPLATEVPK